MVGRYYFETERGKLLFDITRKEGIYDVQIQFVETGMYINPDQVWFEDGKRIVLLSSFIFTLGVQHRLELIWEDGTYRADGSYASVGNLQGELIPFTGKTKKDVMLEELPLKRTGRTVRRSEEEIAKLVDNLMTQMTLGEKIGQMSQSAGSNTAAIGGAVTQSLTIEEMVERGMLGSVIAMNSPENIYELQKRAVENSRLHIPLMFCRDVIHGSQTIFPIPLAWSCSFDPALIGEAGRVAAKEATAVGIMYAFAPMLDIARDPRWGRVSEGNGEDPYLCARICEAQVRGYQGEDLSDDDSMMACLKHFVGYSAAEAGRDYNTCEITETTLRNIYLEPFRAGIQAGAASVMNSFNTMNGVPVAVNRYILRDVLREELGFQGVLVSDFGAVEEAIAHGAAEDGKDAVCKAIRASMDIEMASGLYNTWAKEAIEKGELSETLVDECTRRILTYKFKTGLMDDPYKYLQPKMEEKIFCREYRDIALQLARESVVLLQNDIPDGEKEKVLPLRRDRKVALIGPKGDSTDLLGPWQFSGHKAETITLRQGLEEKGLAVLCEEGSAIHDTVAGGIERAVAAAEASDIVILALGEDMSMSGEAASRQSITVPDAQMRLAEAVKAVGKPTVVVLTNGRPLLVEWFLENTDALVETWFLGTEAGRAIADVLTGDYNPAGKLTISFPRHQGQIPIYYNHLNTGRPFRDGMKDKFLSRYIDGANAPRFPFGYGLSYTQFVYDKLTLSSGTMNQGETVTVSVQLFNTGNMDGTEVVQLYIHDVAASIARPVKELKGFERVDLKAGESRTVSFTVDEEMISFYNAENKKVTETGLFEVFVGGSSDDADLLKEEFMYTGTVGLLQRTI